MQKDFRDDTEDRGEAAGPDSRQPRERRSRALDWISNLVQIGLGESILRAGTNVLSVIAIIVVVTLLQLFYRQRTSALSPAGAQPAAATSSAELAPMTQDDQAAIGGIPRGAQLHTNSPTRPRQDIVNYTVQNGDTVSGIADNYGLQPETIFAANFDILQDDPHNLFAGQELKILPVDGVYWEWLGGISFGAWADYFHVRPQDIINYPGNHLDSAAYPDPANADVKPGTWLIIPGATYSYHQPGSIPLGITRSDPASAQVGGSGACGAIFGGAVGTGAFVFPTDRHYLSGFDYTPKTNHLGIDLAGNEGDPIYASDGGVVVYAGTNGYGYGDMVMIDHGTGFQSLYAHLSLISVSCGQSVAQSQYIGAIGSTGHSSGPHLHFEVRTSSTVINPWNVLPAP